MNPEEEVVVDPTETSTEETVEETPEESPEELKARLAKAEELAKNYKIRAEKAESKAKESTKTEVKVEEKEPTGMSMKDSLALLNAKVHEDDVDEVVEYAKFKGKSVSEVLKTDEMKAILSLKDEYRKTADATNVHTVRRSNTKPSDEALLHEASKGNLPDSPDEIARLVAAKQKADRNS